MQTFGEDRWSDDCASKQQVGRFESNRDHCRLGSCPIRKKAVTRTKATKTVRLAAASGCPRRVERDARLEFVEEGKKCNMKFLDADVKRSMASVSANLDAGTIVVFGPWESYIENTNIGWRIPMSRKKGVFVLQLDAQAESRTAEAVTFDEPNTNEITPIFRQQAEPTCGRKSQ